MKRKIAMAMVFSMVCGMLTGCGAQKEASTAAKDEASGNEASGDAVNFVIWHDCDDAIAKVVEDEVNEKLSEDNISITFEKKSDFMDVMKLYGNDPANGPDMYMHAHDCVGTFAEMGIVTPIEGIVSQETMDGLFDMTVEAGVYKDKQYLMPLYYETLVLITNDALWEGEIPKTTEELYDYMVAHTDENAGVYAVLNQHSTAYNVASFINGFGGYILNSNAQPGLNLDATKEAIAYNKKFAQLQADGDYNTITTLFHEGKAAAIIGGPWLTSGIEAAGIQYSVHSLSDIALPNGNKLAPYAGVYSVGVLNNGVSSEAKKNALGKVLDAMGSKELGEKLALSCGCAPANEAAYANEEVTKIEMLNAIKTTAESAQPMPNVPEMIVLWGPTESLLAEVNKSGADIDKAAETYQQQALTAIEDMK